LNRRTGHGSHPIGPEIWSTFDAVSHSGADAAAICREDQCGKVGNGESGYFNAYLTPGPQFNISPGWQLYGAIYLPVHQYANGYQQVAPWFGLFSVTYQF